jgi:ribosomal protein S21
MIGSILDPAYVRPIEVKVEGSSREDFEYAIRRFKALFQRERIVGQVKERMAYEKPSAKKRRKSREAVDRRVMNQVREDMVKTGEWDRRQKVRAKNQIQREEKRAEVLV